MTEFVIALLAIALIVTGFILWSVSNAMLGLSKDLLELTKRVGSLERTRDRMTQMNWQPVPKENP